MSTAEDSAEEPVPEEYTQEEFPGWLKQLRRAEIVFAGSIPLTILFTNIGYGIYGALSSGVLESSSIDSITESSGLTNEERYDILKISLGISGGIAALDFILGFFQQPEEDEQL